MLPSRNAVADWQHVRSRLVLEGADKRLPTATIAIPTFRRPHLLVETVRSALAQRLSDVYEVIVVDNDPDSTGAADILRSIPELSELNFRYYVNAENMGLFGNFNRCLELARGEWLTILNDDDLLDDDFLPVVMKSLEKQPQIDGLVTRKRYLDLRPKKDINAEAGKRRLFNAGRIRVYETVRHRLFRLHFGLEGTRRLEPGHFFWGPVTGTPLGFMFRRRCALDIGGFYPEEFPAADLWFAARFAARHYLVQHQDVLATVRIAENESAKPETIKKSLQSMDSLHRALAGNAVPRWWMWFAPLIISRLRHSAEGAFSIAVPDVELQQALGAALAADRPKLLAIARLLCGGWHPDPA